MGAQAPRRLDRSLRDLASRQHGVVSRAQLRRLGFGRSALEVRIRAGRLTPVHRGVYLVGHLARPRLATEMAAVLACGESAAVSHRSAAVLWQLVALRNDAGTVDVTVPWRWAPEHGGIRVHRAARLEPCDLGYVERVPITSPARTVRDLAAVTTGGELEAAAAQAERLHGVGLTDLAGQVEGNRGRPGNAALRRLVDGGRRPALTRSKAERRLLSLVRASELPDPEANTKVAGFEVDLLWRPQRLIVEFDGFAFHADRGAFERDRLRDAELAALGYRVTRVTWRQLTDRPESVVNRLRRALAPSPRGG